MQTWCCKVAHVTPDFRLNVAGLWSTGFCSERLRTVIAGDSWGLIAVPVIEAGDSENSTWRSVVCNQNRSKVLQQSAPAKPKGWIWCLFIWISLRSIKTWLHGLWCSLSTGAPRHSHNFCRQPTNVGFWRGDPSKLKHRVLFRKEDIKIGSCHFLVKANYSMI